MGLDITHDCWHGSSMCFNIWRRWLASQIGITLDEMEGFADDRGRLWEFVRAEPLVTLLHHSDCDGKIHWWKCKELAIRLTQIYRGSAGVDTLCELGFDCRKQVLRFAVGCLRA